MEGGNKVCWELAQTKLDICPNKLRSAELIAYHLALRFQSSLRPQDLLLHLGLFFKIDSIVARETWIEWDEWDLWVESKILYGCHWGFVEYSKTKIFTDITRFQELVQGQTWRLHTNGQEAFHGYCSPFFDKLSEETIDKFHLSINEYSNHPRINFTSILIHSERVSISLNLLPPPVRIRFWPRIYNLHGYLHAITAVEKTQCRHRG